MSGIDFGFGLYGILSNGMWEILNVFDFVFFLV